MKFALLFLQLFLVTMASAAPFKFVLSTEKVRVSNVSLSPDSVWIWFDGYWSGDARTFISSASKNSFGLTRAQSMHDKEWNAISRSFALLEGKEVAFKISTNEGFGVRGGSASFRAESTIVEMTK